MKRGIIVLAIILSVTMVWSQGNDKRVALIIGNASYNSSRLLPTSVNDAKMMATTLQEVGFKVQEVYNASYIEMQNALNEFYANIASCNVSFFYFAGYGLHELQNNYILPTDASLSDVDSLHQEAFTLEEINRIYAQYSTKKHLLVVDVSQPWLFEPISFWPPSAGLKTYNFTPITNQSPETLVVYASKEVKCNRRIGHNNFFTLHLSQEILKPQSITDVFEKVLKSISDEMEGEPLPKIYNKLTDNYGLIGENKKIEFPKAIGANNDLHKKALNEITKGNFFDSRDGKEYRWVSVEGKKWMAENLKYRPESGVYSDNSKIPSREALAGFLYNWETAKDVCPSGWRLPNNDEWAKLVSVAGGARNAGLTLKSTSGWNVTEEGQKGVDLLGFSAIPSGYWRTDMTFVFNSNSSGWWSSNEEDNDSAYTWIIYGNSEKIIRRSYNKNYGFVVRCVCDD